MEKSELSKKERTRHELIKAAQKLFARKGYEATGVDEVVSSIGLTSGVFYSNFKSKEALLKTVLEQQIEGAKRLLLDERPGETASDWYRRLIQAYVSPEHRDRIEISCPLTTMSQELLKNGLSRKLGLERYTHQFEEMFRRRLEEIAPGRGAHAAAIIALCVGAVQISRQFADKGQADLYLEQTRRSALVLGLGAGIE